MVLTRADDNTLTHGMLGIAIPGRHTHLLDPIHKYALRSQGNGKVWGVSRQEVSVHAENKKCLPYNLRNDVTVLPISGYKGHHIIPSKFRPIITGTSWSLATVVADLIRDKHP